MRVKSNFDESILHDMNTIMNSEEHKNVFSPLVKSAQEQTKVDSAVGDTANNMNKHFNKDLARRTAPTNVRNLNQDELGVQDNAVAQTAPSTNMTAVLNNIAQGLNPNHAAAARAALSGNVGPGTGQVLLSYFKTQNPGLTPEKLEEQLRSLSTAKKANVSSVIPVILKVANTLGALGFEESEAIADKLIQTITVEAKAKVVEKAKAKEESKSKCKECGSKCDSKGCTNTKCKGKCGNAKRTY